MRGRIERDKVWKARSVTGTQVETKKHDSEAGKFEVGSEKREHLPNPKSIESDGRW